jgi:hypothetical protein
MISIKDFDYLINSNGANLGTMMLHVSYHIVACTELLFEFE